MAAVPMAISLAGGSLIFAGFLVVLFFAFAFSYYTRKGSGISQTPYADLDGSSGPEHPSELHSDFSEEVSNWDRGTAGHHRHQHLRPPVQVTDEEVLAVLHAWRSAAGQEHLAKRDLSVGTTRGPGGGAEVVVFWDYTASDRALAASLAALHTLRPVRETALHLPLADDRPLAWLAARAVEAAGAQHRFWAAHDTLLEHAQLDERTIYAVARLVDDPARFRSDLDNGAVRARILEHIRLAGASGVHTVPSVFIDGVHYSGEPDARALAAEIDRLGAHVDPDRPNPDG